MLRAEIANITCTQIARGGMLRADEPLAWREPARGGDTDEAFAKRRNAERLRFLDSQARALATNTGNLETCRRAAQWLDEAGDRGAAEAVREHIRQQWGRFAASEAA